MTDFEPFIQCSLCAHYHGERRCAAFPEGIPAALRWGKHDHREPFPGDHGITWKRSGNWILDDALHEIRYGDPEGDPPG